MSSELVVDVQPKEISIALLENNRLVGASERGSEHIVFCGRYLFGKGQKADAGT